MTLQSRHGLELAKRNSGVKPSKWAYKAEMIAACNCDWGCPCNFNQEPTNGFCDGAYAANITSGSCGEVRLDGLKWAWAALWPGAIHEGRGTAKVWIDQHASREQRDALKAILKGELGGTPWSIFAPTIDNWLDTSFVPFEWEYEGTKSRYKGGNEIQAVLDAMRNPVTGAEATAKILLPNGLVCKELNPTATKTFSVFTKGLKFAAPGKYGFYATVEHGS
ncbi:MAG TPA: DUF1326 domain-containing protein [Candidatus Bathyarchaeia archaeon]|nr:DUF1326 domain-containing protein [Candidatus Bathyarchaeia archaeon]